MDKTALLHGYQETDTEIDLVRDGRSIAFATEFVAKGMNHSFHLGIDHESGQRLLAIGAQGDTTANALKNGTLLPLPEGTRVNDGYDRTLLIERSLRSGLPLEDSIRLSSGVQDYDSLEKILGDENNRNSATMGTGPASRERKPDIDMLIPKR